MVDYVLVTWQKINSSRQINKADCSSVALTRVPKTALSEAKEIAIY